MQWHQLDHDHMQTVCTSLQTDNHTNTSSLNFKRRMLFLTPNQQCHSTEGSNNITRITKVQRDSAGNTTEKSIAFSLTQEEALLSQTDRTTHCMHTCYTASFHVDWSV